MSIFLKSLTILFFSIIFLSLAIITVQEMIRLWLFEKKMKQRVESLLHRETGLSELSASNKRKLYDGTIVYLVCNSNNKWLSKNDTRYFNVYVKNKQIDSFEEIDLDYKKVA